MVSSRKRGGWRGDGRGIEALRALGDMYFRFDGERTVHRGTYRLCRVVLFSMFQKVRVPCQALKALPYDLNHAQNASCL